MNHARSKPRDLSEVARTIELRHAESPSSRFQSAALTLPKRDVAGGAATAAIAKAGGISVGKIIGATVFCTVAIFSTGLLVGRNTAPPAAAKPKPQSPMALVPSVEPPAPAVPPAIVLMTITKMAPIDDSPPRDEPAPPVVDSPKTVAPEPSRDAAEVEEDEPVYRRPARDFAPPRQHFTRAAAPVEQTPEPAPIEEPVAAAPPDPGVYVGQTLLLSEGQAGAESAAGARPEGGRVETTAARVLELCGTGRTEARREAEHLIRELPPHAAETERLRTECGFVTSHSGAPSASGHGHKSK